jgi:hypothetical protein
MNSHTIDTKDALKVFKKYSSLLPYKLIKTIDTVQLPDGRMAEIQVIVTAVESEWLVEDSTRLLTEINP